MGDERTICELVDILGSVVTKSIEWDQSKESFEFLSKVPTYQGKYLDKFARP